MDAVYAERLRLEWSGKPCDHLVVESEYRVGIFTGWYVCTQCGKQFPNDKQVDDEHEQAVREMVIA